MEISPVAVPPEKIGRPFSLSDLATLLVKHHLLHEGFFTVSVDINMSATGLEMLKVDGGSFSTVGGIFGIGDFTLTKVAQLGPLVVDASIVNPRPAAG